MYTMPDTAPRPSHDRWRDIDGIHRGQVVGRCLDSLYVADAPNIGHRTRERPAQSAIVTATSRGNSALRVIRRSSRHHDD
jgi:hypothetical protein